MSLQFDPVHIKDSRLQVKGTDLAFAVQSGGSSVNSQSFSATSSSTSQHVYNVTVPSLTVGVSRRVVLKTKVRFSLTGIPKNGDYLWNAGLANGALAAMPIQAGLVQTASVQINNTTVSWNSDTMPAFLRMLSQEDILDLNSTTPCAVDRYREFSAATNATNNVLAGYNSASLDSAFIGRGSYPITVISNPVGDGTNSRTTVLEVLLSEPLVISPFAFSSHQKCSALFGVNTINVTLNLNQSPVGFWKTDGTQLQSGGLSVSIQKYEDSQLLFDFISPQASDLAKLPSICTVDYTNIPRYITSAGTVNANSSATIVATTVQLNSIPDLMAIYVRRTQASQTPVTTDHFLSIRNISLNWSNRSGLLASMSTEQLYAMSKKNGNHAQNWLEFYGRANLTTSGSQDGNSVPLTGSLLLVQPVIDFGVEPYESNSSYGQYTCQFTLQVQNEGADNVAAEIVLLCFNSGFLQCQSGTSALFEGVLSKEQVLSAIEKPAISTADYSRMLGSGILSKVKSGAMYLHQKLIPKVKELLATSTHPYAQKGVEVLKSLGYGRSGGARKDARLK